MPATVMGERLSPSANRPPELSHLPAPAAGRSGWPWTAASPGLPERLPNGAPWPRITIVTPSYNQAEFLEETLRSVLLQGYPDLEYFVMDGGSTDASPQIIERYAPWLAGYASERDRGQSHAINKGLARSTGAILGWLNSDDTFEPGALARVAQAFAEHPQAFLISGQAHYISRTGQRTGQAPARAFDRQRMLTQDNSIPQPSAFFSRPGWQSVGELDEDLHFTMDYDLWFRLGERGPSYFIPEFLSNQRIYPEAKTSAGHFRFYREVSQVAQRYGGSGLPAGFKKWLADTHLPRAWAAYRAGELQVGETELGYVLEHAPAWRDPQRLAPEIARYAWGLNVGLSGLDTAALEFAERVCAHLPAAVAQPARLRRHVLATLHQASAQRHFARGEPVQVWRRVGQTLLREPRRAGDRGLWALAARSLVRPRLGAGRPLPLAPARQRVISWLETERRDSSKLASDSAALLVQLRAMCAAPALFPPEIEALAALLRQPLAEASDDSRTWPVAAEAVSALRLLNIAVSEPLNFVARFRSTGVVEAWLTGLDWAEPEVSSRPIQGLAVGLVHAHEITHDPSYQNTLNGLGQWLAAHAARNGEPWCFGESLPWLAALSHAAHLAPLFGMLSLPLPQGEPFIARLLDQQQFSGLFGASPPDAAWADFAAVDTLARLSRQTSFRADQIHLAMALVLRALLRQQQPAGGFAASAASDLRTTWLRALTLAVISARWPVLAADSVGFHLPGLLALGAGHRP